MENFLKPLWREAATLPGIDTGDKRQYSCLKQYYVGGLPAGSVLLPFPVVCRSLPATCCAVITVRGDRCDIRMIIVNLYTADNAST
ncbi:hypothetical protein J6590_071500 [Homalodisca vitripennis]|nr:hypothetical protein J6590_071500 [Homalodisca vitripennis]